MWRTEGGAVADVYARQLVRQRVRNADGVDASVHAAHGDTQPPRAPRARGDVLEDGSTRAPLHEERRAVPANALGVHLRHGHAHIGEASHDQRFAAAGPGLLRTKDAQGVAATVGSVDAP
jgi:hypothetical protein